MKGILFIALCCLSFFSGQVVSANDCNYNEVYFNQSDWHTDFILKTEDYPFLADRYGGYEYVVIGFGDEQFWKAGAFFDKSYWEQFSIAFDSLFLADQGIMSVYGFTGVDPRDYAKEVIRFNQEDYKSIVNYVSSSFELSDSNEPIFIDSVGRVDLYRSSVNYSILRTCNGWTAEVLSKSSIFNFKASTSDGVLKVLSKSRIPRGESLNSCESHRKVIPGALTNEELMEKLNNINIH